MHEEFAENSSKDPIVSSKDDKDLELKEFVERGSDTPEPLDSRAGLESKKDSFDGSIVGTVFANKYEVLSYLGKGGMSTVYKVRHTELDVVMALKVLHKHLWTDPLSVERFRMEAKTIGKLSSSYLVTFRDFGVTTYGQPYLVMDYLDGISLGKKIAQEGKIGLNECLDVFEKLSKGLEEAHRNGVTHRDIKPDNVVFLSDGSDSNVKLVDFGIAKIAAEESDQRMTLTQTGEVFGSPLFMSPEQCLGVTVDHRSDIYSMGCLFYEAIVGEPPFLEPTILETMNAHLQKKPLNLNEQDEGLVIEAKGLGIDFQDLNYLVMKCLQKNPIERYQSARELREDLEKVRNKQSISGKQKLWKQTSPARKALGIVSVVALSLVVLFVAVYFVNPQFKTFANDMGMQSGWQYHYLMGRTANTMRDFQAAESHYRESLEIANHLLSPADKHSKRLVSLDSLSKVLQYQAKYRDKDIILEEYKKELRKSLGELSNLEEETLIGLVDTVNIEDRESSLKSANLFFKLGKQSASNGKTKDAEEYLDKCYEIRNKWLKEGSKSLIEVMDSLALVSVLRGNHRKAGRLWQQAFNQAEQYLSDESKVKVSLYNNMGRIYQSPRKKNYKEAERCYKRAIELSKKLYGVSSKKTLNVMQDYAAFLNIDGRKSEAEKLWQEIEQLKRN